MACWHFAYGFVVSELDGMLVLEFPDMGRRDELVWGRRQGFSGYGLLGYLVVVQGFRVVRQVDVLRN